MKKIFAFLLFFTIFLIGCYNDPLKRIKLDFFVDDTFYTSTIISEYKLELPVVPVKEGYIFEGWQLDGLNEILNEEVLNNLVIGRSYIARAKFNDINTYANCSQFYSLQESYDLGYLTQSDLLDISYNFKNSASNLESLSVIDHEKIKRAFAFKANNDSLYSGGNVYYSYEDVFIDKYCGTYGAAIVVYISGIYSYTQALKTDIVGGVEFFYSNGNSLRVFVEHDFLPIKMIDLLSCYTENVATCNNCGITIYQQKKEEHLYAITEYDDIPGLDKKRIGVCNICGHIEYFENDIFCPHLARIKTITSNTSDLKIREYYCAGICEKIDNCKIIKHPFDKEYKEGDIVSMLGLEFNLYIWNDYMPPIAPGSKNTNCALEISSSKNPDYIPELELSAILEFNNQTITIDEFNFNYSYRPKISFKGFGDYTMYLIIRYNGFIQAVPLKGKSFSTH